MVITLQSHTRASEGGPKGWSILRNGEAVGERVPIDDAVEVAS